MIEDYVDITVTDNINVINITPSVTDEIVDINISDNREDVTINVTDSIIEVNINKITSILNATWGTITGTLSDQTDLQTALNAKQNSLSGTGFVKIAGTTISYDNTNYFPYPSGTTAQYIRGNGTLATFPTSSGTVTSVGLSMPSAFSVANSPITSSGTLAVTGAGDTTQYIAGDGSLITFPTAGQSGSLVREVRNTSGATMTKGTIVYINGANGNKPTIAKAKADAESTSARTFGLIQADIANNSNGYVVIIGDITGLDTSALTEGNQLYLSGTTAGAYTTTKSLAPIHLVYIGKVTRSHPTQGQIEVQIQNGYELDEIHDVAISSIANNDSIFWESSSSLWKNKSIATVLGFTPISLSSLSASSPLSYNSGTGAFSIQVASGSQNGYLSSTDWNTFNSKAAALSGTINTLTYWASATTIGSLALATYPSLTEISYVKGVTSAIQTQLNGKQATITNPITGTGISNYISKFNGTGTSITNSLIYDDGTNVSIGTTTGTGLFNVNGSKTASSAIAKSVNITSTLVASANNDILVGLDIVPTFTNGAFTGVQNNAIRINTGNLLLSTTSQIRFGNNSYFSSDGVGIFSLGYSSNQTDAVLKVNSITTVTLSGGFASGTNTAGTNMTFVPKYGTGTGLAANFVFNVTQQTTSGSLAHTTLQAMSLFGQTGNLLLQNGGTFTDAGYRLDVNGTTRLQSSLYLPSLTTNYIPKIGTSGLVSNSLIYDNGTNVGIGTTVTNGKLTVLESVTSFEVNTSSTLSSILSYDRTGGAYKNLQFRGYDFIFSPSDVEKMRLTNGGSLGIGTTAPTSKLHVSGLSAYANNAAAIAGGLTVGAFYYTNVAGDGILKVVI